MPKPKISNPVSRLVIDRNRNLNLNRNRNTETENFQSRIKIDYFFSSSQSTSQETDEKANYEGGELDNAQEISGESIFRTNNTHKVTS
jgi:hypothetical protein